MMDESIVKLRAELKAKEAELNRAILARGDRNHQLSVTSQELEPSSYSSSCLFP